MWRLLAGRFFCTVGPFRSDFVSLLFFSAPLTLPDSPVLGALRLVPCHAVVVLRLRLRTRCCKVRRPCHCQMMCLGGRTRIPTMKWGLELARRLSKLKGPLEVSRVDDRPLTGSLSHASGMREKKGPLIMSKEEYQWQSLTKECQRALIGKKSKHKQKQPKQETQIEQSDQSSKYYTLAEKLELKKSGVLPLGFNEHTKILRSSNLTNLSVDQSIKSIVNA